MTKPLKIVPGLEFGYLKVTARSDRANHWECLCSCGKISTVRRDHLIDGSTSSCGCQQHRRIADKNKTHGMSKSRVYRIWRGMHQRVSDEGARKKYYLDKGITVDPSWESFENFYRDMGEPPTSNHSLDRIDGDKPYGPENCRWASSKVQGRNKSNNIVIDYLGESRPLSEWCEKLKLNYSTTHRRIHVYGWNPVKALTEPVVVGGPANKPKRQPKLKLKD